MAVLPTLGALALLTEVLDPAGRVFPFRTADVAICDEAYGGGGAFGAYRAANRKHAGCDLDRPRGTPIRAVEDGLILDFYNFYEQTWAIEVKGTSVIRYSEVDVKSLGKLGLKPGDRVQKGATLGFVGGPLNSGNEMLHFEMYSGEAKGPLTVRTHLPYQRRSDLKDPTAFLKALRANIGKSTLKMIFASENTAALENTFASENIAASENTAVGNSQEGTLASVSMRLEAERELLSFLVYADFSNVSSREILKRFRHAGFAFHKTVFANPETGVRTLYVAQAKNGAISRVELQVFGSASSETVQAIRVQADAQKHEEWLNAVLDDAGSSFATNQAAGRSFLRPADGYDVSVRYAEPMFLGKGVVNTVELAVELGE